MRKQFALALVLVLLCCGLTGCIRITGLGHGIVNNRVDYTYENAGEYTGGGTELAEPVRELDISWVSGTVTVEYHEGSTVKIEERCGKRLTDSTRLFYRYKDGRLQIKYAEAGLLQVNDLEKYLTVSLPQGMEPELLTLQTTSADGKLMSIAARKVAFDSVSGDLYIEGGRIQNELEAETTSGGMVAVLLDDLKKLDWETVSGSLEVVSEGTINKVSSGSTSGDMELALTAVPQELEWDAVSGDCKLYLPGDSSFTAEFDSVSGVWKSDIPVTADGSTYTAGSGTANLEFDTTSGDVTIIRN